MRILSAAFGAAAFLLSAASSIAATTSCSSVAACLMGTNSSSGPGVGGTSKNGFGLSGISTSGHGVNGTSSSSFGVVGVTTENATSTSTARAGVYGEDLSTNKKAYNSGVSGTSEYGYGGSFSSLHGVGLSATSAAIGTAKLGFTTVVGFNDGLDVTPDGGIEPGAGYSGDSAIRAYANSSNVDSDMLYTGIDCATDSHNPVEDCREVISFDAFGDATFAGSVSGNGTPAFRTKDTSGSDVMSFGARTAAPSLEDVGKAQLRNGAAYVTLDRAFASAIDAHVAYSVFITPEGDSNSLYTTQLSPNGFTVRESKGGRSSLTFDYRIVAKPLDAKSMHLPAVSGFAKFATHVTVPARVLGQRRR